jgi:AraC family transcriptional regulator of adaptative response/methylated-DNA-[protein]-cysteine methyltransferase
MERREATIVKVCRYLEAHYDQTPDLATLASLAGLSRFHFLRTFREATGLTPRGYASLCRMRALKANLRSGSDVTRAMVDVGFGSPSRLYEKSSRELGMTPRAYRNGGLGVKIRYTIVPSPLGRMLIAATGKGICAIRFGDAPEEMARDLRAEFPLAELAEDAAPLLDWVAALNEHLAGERCELRLPLDIEATLFQRRVWEILQRIPYGETRTYAEIAQLAGNPKAVRAVGSACGANPVAVAIPCHRALRSDGSLGGYRWGLSRKVQLLETEKTSKDSRAKRSARTAPVAG